MRETKCYILSQALNHILSLANTELSMKTTKSYKKIYTISSHSEKLLVNVVLDKCTLDVMSFDVVLTKCTLNMTLDVVLQKVYTGSIQCCL